MTLGEHPPFSPAELAEIRRLATEKHHEVHQEKNMTAVPPWAPRDGEEIVVVRISKDDASRLTSWIAGP